MQPTDVFLAGDMPSMQTALVYVVGMISIALVGLSAILWFETGNVGLPFAASMLVAVASIGISADWKQPAQLTQLTKTLNKLRRQSEHQRDCNCTCPGNRTCTGTCHGTTHNPYVVRTTSDTVSCE